MKEPVRKLLDRLRAHRRDADASLAGSALDSNEPPANSATGCTVFDDVALRLRNLTVEQLDTSAGDPGSLPGAFKIRLARTRDTGRGATTLVERRYGSRGFRVPAAPGDPNLYTFVAYDEGRLVGTVSIRLDSDKGLSGDALYKPEIDQFRTAGHRLCEFTRLAVDVRAVSKPVLAGLFHTAYLYAAKVRGFDVAVIEVNPRHVAFYVRALCFEPIGPERLNARVNAPSVLLCVPFDAIAGELMRFAGRPELAAQTRSLFPYGFSESEAAGILARLRKLDRATT